MATLPVILLTKFIKKEHYHYLINVLGYILDKT